MKSTLRSMVTLAALGLVGAVASGAAGAEPAPAVGAETPAANTPHGLIQLIGDALGDVSLRPDQQDAVEALGAKVEPLQATVDQAESDLLTMLAEQVSAGAIDLAAIEPNILAYATAREDVSAGLRSAIEELHLILDPTQRMDFADSLECGVHDVLLALTSGERLDDFAQTLGLNDAQKQDLSDDLGELTPMLDAARQSLHAVIEGFRSDTFSIEQFMPQNEVFAKAEQRAEMIVDVTDLFMDVLNPSQRDELAQRIREAAKVRSDMSEQQTQRIVVVHRRPQVRAFVARGPRGGVVVGRARGYYYGRARAYPVAVGWGYGW